MAAMRTYEKRTGKAPGGHGFLDALREDGTVRLQRLLDTNPVARLGPVRRRRPVLSLGSTVLVTRREDVLAVLADPDTFPLTYADRLPGAFVLGLTGVQHRRHTAELRAVMRPEDGDRLATMVADEAERRIRAALGTGSIDVGTDLVHPVLDLVVGSYLGAPGPDPVTQLRWARALFRNIFLNPGDLPAIRERAERAAAEMGAHLDRLIAERTATEDEAAGDGPDDVLGRLLARRREHPDTALSDAEIRDNLMGLGIGWLWHGAKAAVIAVDELLDRPAVLARAREAAADGDRERLRRILWEVYRFRPVQPGLLRGCARDTLLAAGTPSARLVRAGRTVFVGTHSAMWDETDIPDPGTFDETRADGQYLVFGDGLHRCVGERIMRIQLPALLEPLLRRDGLRRADGSPGRLRWAGPDPDRLRVELPR